MKIFLLRQKSAYVFLQNNLEKNLKMKEILRTKTFRLENEILKNYNGKKKHRT